MTAAGKPKTSRTSPFGGTPAGGWTPTRKQPAMKRELTGDPPTLKDDAAPPETPANGVASHGSADSRKI